MHKTIKFYKYQPLSEEKHFTFLQNYLNQKVWMVPLEQFNDPFEGMFNIAPSMYGNRLNNHDELGSNNSQIIALKRHGALCLTTKNNNAPMWSYYADNHKGYCVEFELDLTSFCKKTKIPLERVTNYMDAINQGLEVLATKVRNIPQSFIFTKVRYINQIPTISIDRCRKLFASYDQIKYIVENSVGVKSREWQHEDEYRLVVNGNSDDSGLLPLEGYASFLRVTGIIIGYQMDSEKIIRVHELCKKKKLRIYKADFSRSNYEIIINQHHELPEIESNTTTI